MTSATVEGNLRSVTEVPLTLIHLSVKVETRTEVLAAYKVTSNGIIQSPGKFEAEILGGE